MNLLLFYLPGQYLLVLIPRAAGTAPVLEFNRNGTESGESKSKFHKKNREMGL
jgi:hypothetical protein